MSGFSFSRFELFLQRKAHYTSILEKETTGNSLPSKWIIKKKTGNRKKTFRAKVKLILKRGYIQQFF